MTEKHPLIKRREEHLRRVEERKKILLQQPKNIEEDNGEEGQREQ